MLDMHEAIRQRKSVRTYEDRLLAPDLLGEIEALVETQTQGFFGGAPRFALIERDQARSSEKVKVGSYGLIKGARYFVAGAVARGPHAEADFGYCMERIVLEMARRGLGTCWIGGVFSRKEFGKALRLDEDSWVPAVLTAGYPATKRGTIDRLTRWGSKGDDRLPWSSLFFENDFSHPLTREAAGPYAEALDMVRIGPSASNKQPWRALRTAQGYHLFLARTPGYRKWVPSTDLQMVDMGIAMRHFEESARSLGLPGRWEVVANAPPAGEAEYVVSWIGDFGVENAT